MLELSNCYKVLHLEEDCSDLELRKRYRKFALECHPDKLKVKEFPLKNQDTFFMKISDAYRQIVSFRKGQKRLEKRFGQRYDVQSQQSQKSFSFEDIRARLADLNKVLSFQQEGTKERPISVFDCEVNRIYDEHMKVINNLSQKLKEMRQH